MQSFDLTVSDQAGHVLGTLPAAAQPYGQFGRGDAFDFGGKRYSIELVGHAIIPTGPNHLCRTLLVLGPFQAASSTSHSFPTVAANSGNGGGWVVGNG